MALPPKPIDEVLEQNSIVEGVANSVEYILSKSENQGKELKSN